MIAFFTAVNENIMATANNNLEKKLRNKMNKNQPITTDNRDLLNRLKLTSFLRGPLRFDGSEKHNH